ncbi:TRAP transporter large permease [Nitrospirillum sp. BR 11828]|uniref:TRAP transporter large permease n=1 Tax=Nitrospirillum sp. BR 11828 TaxID=3104325 RepID=UPI002ACAA14C|nr:TRAP transporter large permease [Nitrospirillum sp. BR 11828]MDZ5647905.1 TRAP transporter large permease [Nitrospirillum sp. BR 11828]
MDIAILFGAFAILLLLGVPVGFSLAAASVAAIVAMGLPPMVLVQQMTSGISSTAMIAIPLFIFAGELMMRGGISERLIGLASALVGHLRGGLGQVNVLASAFFGGVSGSAIADASAIGGTMIPQMVARGFDRDYAVNVTITSALVALMVPPSHNMILYSAAGGGGISIADLFAAGILPAVVMAAALMVTAYLIARKRGYAVEPFPGLAAVVRRFISASPGLLLVVLVFGGVRAGIFTAVESAAIAVVYAVIITVAVYRRLGWKDFKECCAGSAHTTGIILFMIGAASAFGWLMSYLQVPAAAVAALKAMAGTKVMVLLIMNVILLALSTFMDMGPKIIICTPIFLPVAKAFGIDPVQFGVIMMLNGGIGLITPPIGSVLFVGSAIGKVPVGQLMRSIWPFYLAAGVVLMLVSYIPFLSLWLPNAMK